MELIHKIPSNFHCLTDTYQYVDYFQDILSSFLLPSLSKRIRERRGDNFHSFFHLSCIYSCPSSISFQLPWKEEEEEDPFLPPSSDFYYSTFKYCLFLDIPFLERPTSQSAPPPLSHFLGIHISSYFQYG